MYFKVRQNKLFCFSMKNFCKVLKIAKMKEK